MDFSIKPLVIANKRSYLNGDTKKLLLYTCADAQLREHSIVLRCHKYRLSATKLDKNEQAHLKNACCESQWLVIDLHSITASVLYKLEIFLLHHSKTYCAIHNAHSFPQSSNRIILHVSLFPLEQACTQQPNVFPLAKCRH